MAAATASSFPLAKVSEAQLQRLGQILWSWSLCGDCQNQRTCITESCPWQRSKRLKPIFDHYKDLTASYEPEFGPSQSVALGAHEALFEIIQRLKANPDITRWQFAIDAFQRRPGRDPPPLDEQMHATNLAVKIMTMMNCSAQYQGGGLIEQGTFEVPWRNDTSFSQFILDAVPKADKPYLTSRDGSTKTALVAGNLKRIGVIFKPTHNLREHLKLDREKNVLYIFHYTSFLKETLRITKDQPSDTSIAETLKLGALPRQLALECLDSVQKILFPLTDPISKSILVSLTENASFDPDCLLFESASIRNQDEKEISYYYFGMRLLDLYAELEDPTPRGWVEKWFERRSGARYVMMATFVGVIAAVILGILGVVSGAFQAWVAYQQWKHPIASN